ncbi:MAG: Putative metal-dependent phosphoesterase, PHP family, partial [Thermotogales bacterium 46_20]
MHTVFSDGTDTVHELFLRSLEAGIKLISITDHDNIDAQATAMNCAQDKDLPYIPAVEISCEGPGTLDLLGYGINLVNSDLLNMLSLITHRRRERNIRLIERMKELGIRISDEETDTLASE